MKISIAAVVVLAAASSMAFAQDGGTVYKTAKCAMCHGDAGQGKPAMGAPKLAGTTKSADAIVNLLTKGGAPKGIHIKPMNGLTPDQAKAVAAFVKTLK
jgi:cytochrome c553